MTSEGKRRMFYGHDKLFLSLIEYYVRKSKPFNEHKDMTQKQNLINSTHDFNFDSTLKFSFDKPRYLNKSILDEELNVKNKYFTHEHYYFNTFDLFAHAQIFDSPLFTRYIDEMTTKFK